MTDPQQYREPDAEQDQLPEDPGSELGDAEDGDGS